MLPNFSRLGLARTGMVADDDVDDNDVDDDDVDDDDVDNDAAAPSDPAPGEVAALHDQYMETSDFFVTVLQQIDDGSDSLIRVCEAALSWCATDKGRWATCKDENIEQEWVKLTEKLFTKYGLPQDGEENPPSPYANFVSLCNMDRVKRLVRIGRRCYRANQQRLVLEGEGEDEDEDEDNDEREGRLRFRALVALFAEPEASNETSDDFPGTGAWTTERDDQADVALALTVLAEEFSQDVTEFVQERIRQDVIRQIARLEDVNSTTTSRPQVVRMRAQLARLTSWLFTRLSLSDRMDPLYPYGGVLCQELYGLIDQLIDAHELDLDLFEPLDNVDYDLDSLAKFAWTAVRDVAKYNDDKHDWSAYAIPSSKNDPASPAKFMLWFLRNRTPQPIIHLVLNVIHCVLRMPSANRHMPETPLKVRFLRSLVDAKGITHIGNATIGDPMGRSWSMVALETIAEQLAQLDRLQRKLIY